MGITIKYLQEYIRLNDYNPELLDKYFMKLAEETGELSRAMRKHWLQAEGAGVRGTIGEELWDVIYYALAIANCYDIDLETVIPQKEKLNGEKYKNNVKFDPK